jgi:hypothetical protein
MGSSVKLLAASAVIMAFSAVPQVAAAPSGSAQFCLQTLSSVKCVYATMGDCERARGDGSNDQCITRTDAHGVTGLGDPPVRSPQNPAPSGR